MTKSKTSAVELKKARKEFGKWLGNKRNDCRDCSNESLAAAIGVSRKAIENICAGVSANLTFEQCALIDKHLGLERTETIEKLTEVWRVGNHKIASLERLIKQRSSGHPKHPRWKRLGIIPPPKHRGNYPTKVEIYVKTFEVECTTYRAEIVASYNNDAISYTIRIDGDQHPDHPFTDRLCKVGNARDVAHAKRHCDAWLADQQDACKRAMESRGGANSISAT